MLFQNNNLELKQTLPISSLSIPQNVQKKNLFQIEPLQTPFNSNFIPKTNTIIHLNQIYYPNIKHFDQKPKFPEFQTEKANSLFQNIPPFKFIINKEQNSEKKLENNQIEENQEKKNNNEIKKPKEIKIKKKKIKKFKIYHIEFKKLSEKDKILNKQRHKRKYKPDDIRKKIKARFHKSIKNIINDNLRKAGSKKLFTYLPQVFISSITKEKNRNVFDLSFREILQKDFISEADGKKYKNRNVDIAKYKRNIGVLEYLDNNPEICQNSGFDIISKMKYADLLKEYFKSEEFERAISKLREENEDEEYIREYIVKSKNYLNFFMDIPFKKKNNKFKIEERTQKNIEDKEKEV
jgi:hypothetical protein